MQCDPRDVDDLRYSLLNSVNAVSTLANPLENRGTLDSSDSWKAMAEDHDVCYGETTSTEDSIELDCRFTIPYTLIFSKHTSPF